MVRPEIPLRNHLWLWTDTILIPAERDDSGNISPERLELAPPDVKVAVVLPLYGYALVVASLAAEAHVQKQFGGGGEKMRELYGSFIDRHIEALSLPQGWSDTNQRALEGDHTIQQRIRSRISAHVVPQSKYSNNGICRFDVVIVNGLLRTVTKSHEVQSERPEGGNNILCTYPESILPPEEKEAEDSDLSLLYVAQLFELLESLRVRGSVPRAPFVGRFPEWTAAQADIYWTREGRFTKMARQIWPRNIPDFDEVLSFPQPWEEAKHVPGGGSIIYGGMPDGTWLWWRHTGAEQPELRDTWSGGSVVLSSGRGLPWVRSRHVFGGGDGVLYGVAERNETFMLPDGTPSTFVRKGDLMWMRHDGFITGSGAFSPERKIATGWDAYTHLFSMGEGVLYSISADGFLHWHKHEGWRSGVGDVDGHMIVGNGWFGISHVFGAGNGLIYARDTAGRMFCYRHLGWRDGSNRYEDRVEIIDLFPEKLLSIFASLSSSELFNPPG